jgi:hypothetical protein
MNMDFLSMLVTGVHNQFTGPLQDVSRLNNVWLGVLFTFPHCSSVAQFLANKD